MAATCRDPHEATRPGPGPPPWRLGPDAAHGQAITVLLADAQPVVCEGIRAWLRGEPGLKVVAEAGNGLEACDLAERLRPGVAVLEIALPVLGGLEAMRQIRLRSPGTRLIVFSTRAREDCVLAALRAGALAFVSKQAPGAELLHAIREAAAGRSYLPEPFHDLAVSAYAEKERRESDGCEALTAREREVLHLVAQGHTSLQIAGLLYLSPRTIERHRVRIIAKLGLHGAGALLRFALARCTTPPDL